MDGQGNLVCLEVRLHLAAVHVADDAIGDEETSAPLFVDIGKVLMLWVEDVVDELEACERWHVSHGQNSIPSQDRDRREATYRI